MDALCRMYVVCSLGGPNGDSSYLDHYKNYWLTDWLIDYCLMQWGVLCADWPSHWTQNAPSFRRSAPSSVMAVVHSTRWQEHQILSVRHRWSAVEQVQGSSLEPRLALWIPPVWLLVLVMHNNKTKCALTF